MNTEQFVTYWRTALDIGKDMSYHDLTKLTHKTQVDIFGFCTCEEQEHYPYDDCPREKELA